MIKTIIYNIAIGIVIGIIQLFFGSTLLNALLVSLASGTFLAIISIIQNKT